MAKYEMATGLIVYKASAHVWEHFFLVRSRASMVDDDAIVEKLIRSDGNSRSCICIAARDICICIHAPDTFAKLHIFFPLYIYIRTEKYGIR